MEEKALALFELIENNGSVLKKEEAICQEVLSCLKTLLNADKKDSWISMCLLSSVLNHCEREIFEDNSLIWYKLTLKIANAVPSHSLLSLCFENLASIISKSQCVEKISRELSTKGLEPLLQLITDTSIPLLPITFHLIITCINCFPGPCGRFNKALEKLIVQSANSKDLKISSAAVRCFSWLPLCGSGGEKHTKHIESWHNYVNSLLKTIYKVSSDLVNSNGPSDVTSDVPFSFLLRESKECIGVFRLQYLDRSLQMLESILSKSTSYPVQAPITILVSTLCEVANLLQVDFDNVAEFISEPFTTTINLRKVIASLMKCIETCCIQFSMLLAPYTNALCKILANVISSSVMVSKGNCYRLFTTFVQQLSLSPVNTALFADLIDSLCNDVRIQLITETKTQETSAAPPKSGKKKNKQSKMYSKDIASSKQARSFNSLSKNQVDNTLTALYCLERVIVGVGPLCTKPIMEAVISRVLGVCEKIIQHNSGITGQYTTENQLQLFKVLYAIANLHHSKVQVPVSIILSIFSNVSTHGKNLTLASYCNQCLLNFDKVLHNASPELRENAKVSVFEDKMEEEVKENALEDLKEEKMKVDNWTQSDLLSPVQNVLTNGSSTTMTKNQQSHQQSQPKHTEGSLKSPSGNRSSNNKKIISPDASQRSSRSGSSTPADDNNIEPTRKADKVGKLTARISYTEPAKTVTSRNSDPSSTSKSIFVEEDVEEDAGVDKDVVVVEISEDEDVVEMAATTPKPVGGAAVATKRARSDEDVDFEMLNGAKQQCISSDDQELQAILSTMCE